MVLLASDVVLSEVRRPQGLESGLLQNSETSLTGVLTRSKTNAPDKRIPVFLDKNYWFAVKIGFNILQELAPYEREYLLPSPEHNHAGIREVEVSYDASLATTTSLHRGFVAEGQELLDPALCVYWTPHSPWSFMATCCAALGVAKAERNVLGRWAQNQSDTYVRTLAQKLKSSVVAMTKSVVGKGESLQELGSVLEERGVDREAFKRQLTRLDKATSPGPAPPQATETQPLQAQVEALEEEMVQSGRFKRKRLTWSFGDNPGAKLALTSRNPEAKR